MRGFIGFNAKCSAKTTQNSRSGVDILTLFVTPNKRKQPPSRAVESNILSYFRTAKLINNSHTGKQMSGKTQPAEQLFFPLYL